VTNITGTTALTGNTNVTIYDPGAPAYLLVTSGGAVTLTDQLPSITVDSDISGDTQVGITEDSAANAGQVVIDKPASGTNTFKVETTGTGSTAIGFEAASPQSQTTLTINGTDASHNNGLFWVAGDVNAVGAYMGSGAFTNGGYLEVDSNFYATGVSVTGTGSVSNTFQMHVQALTGVGVSFANASGSSFTNAANAILEVDDLAGTAGVGIAIGGAYASGQWLTINNAGDLHADTAIEALTSGVSATPIVHLTNTGTIEGNIDLGIGPFALNGAGSQIINNGQITGSVYLDTNGADLYDSSAGAGQASAVWLGAGTDTVHLGSAGGIVHGGAGSAVITGTTGAMTVYSGTGAETVTGSSAADTFAFGPGLGADVVTNYSAAQGDKIDLTAFTTLQTWSQILPLISQQGSNTVITVGSGSVTLDGVTASSLTAADFNITSGPSVGPGIGGTPTTGNGLIVGTAGSDWLQGGSGNDTLEGLGGSDYLDGGGGLNTSLYTGGYRQYDVVIGLPMTTVGGGPEGGTDDLVNIQRIQFVDGYLATSPTDTAGQVYRLYEAALDRLPDPVGLAGWTHALNDGTSLQSVAAGFVGSQEFQNTYGALSDSAFITLLYNNVLHRAPDPNGLTGWEGYMAEGHTQADVLLGFTESQEDINDSAAAIGQGLWIQDAAAAEVARLYDTVLDRLPDIGGLTGWTNALENGTLTLIQVAQDFVASTEFQNVYGNLTDTQFVTRLYENALHREPDPAGLTGWLGFLAEGNSRTQVVLDFSESQEHINDTAAHINDGIWLA
jgi:hypothetical protein